jgi:hypothetical protein
MSHQLEQSFMTMNRQVTGYMAAQADMHRDHLDANVLGQRMAVVMAKSGEATRNETRSTQILIFDGSEKEAIWEWLRQMEILHQETGLNLITLAKRRSGGPVQEALRCYPDNHPWEAAKKMLKERFSDMPTEAHAAMMITNCVRKAKETLETYMYRFSNIVWEAYQIHPYQATDILLISNFRNGLNDEKVRNALLKAEEGGTLEDAFTKVRTCLNYRLKQMMADSSTASQILSVNAINVDEATCFGCGGIGHFKRNCPHKDQWAAYAAKKTAARLQAMNETTPEQVVTPTVAVPRPRQPADNTVVGHATHTLEMRKDVTADQMTRVWKAIQQRERNQWQQIQGMQELAKGVQTQNNDLTQKVERYKDERNNYKKVAMGMAKNKWVPRDRKPFTPREKTAAPKPTAPTPAKPFTRSRAKLTPPVADGAAAIRNGDKNKLTMVAEIHALLEGIGAEDSDSDEEEDPEDLIDVLSLQAQLAEAATSDDAEEEEAVDPTADIE